MNKIDDLVSKLINYKNMYYSGNPIVSDEEFDKLEDELKKLDPNNSYFNIVGNIDNEGDVKHNFPMLSMDKIKFPKQPLYSWYNRIHINDNEEIILTPKIDGNACTLVYDNGIFKYAATRGNGKIGKIISFGERYDIVKNLPIDGIVEIRGELYIPKKFGKTIFKDQPLRNNAAGIIRSGEKIEFLDFIAYQIIFNNIENIFKKELDILNYLKQLQFDTVPYITINKPDELENEIKKYISIYRNKYEYETDGMVAIVNDKNKQIEINNRRTIRTFYYHNIAIKPPTKIVKSKLLDIEINVSKSGRLIPVAIFEPILIDNVEFERATLNNYEYIKSFGKMYVGNSIYLTRGNDIIITLLDIEEDGNKNLPINISEFECPSCKSQLIQDGKHKVCPNNNCSGRNISTIYNWILKRNMKNVGIKFLELAYEKGFIRSIVDLYDPKLESKIETLERFIPGGGKVNKIISAIEKSKENVTDIDILSSIGIPGIGRSVLENINVTNIDTLPTDILGKNNYKIDKESTILPKNDLLLSNLAVYKYISDWLTIPGNYANLIKLKKILKSKSYNIDKNSKSVVITGTFEIPRKDLEKILINKGYKVSDHVNKNTEMLIVGEDSEGHSKLKKARDLGSVKIVDIKEIL